MTNNARLVRDSFELLQQQSPHAILKLFYGRLFNLDPSLRPLFTSDINVQTQKLADSLATVIGALDKFDAARPILRELGARHVSYGVKPHHYDTVRKSLLWALGQALQQDFDPDTRQAWDQLLQEVSAEMLSGAAQPVP
jgi:hemoglobin-like flavoprotein